MIVEDFSFVLVFDIFPKMGSPAKSVYGVKFQYGGHKYKRANRLNSMVG